MIDERIRRLLCQPDGPRFFLWGGYVVSQYDRQRHYIAAGKLIALYGLPESRCVLAMGDARDEQRMQQRVVLGPRTMGDYREHLASTLARIW